ncbi:(2Fe-2S)-binding protein [Pyrococcus furiosus DSM 3638]|uniref:(2Fe-2S)-binding protein n=3 Tax=Pyrococcus furiosus TaxID=2261 RepID=A0A5C0XRK3_PYRFU|nr:MULTISPECIES: (2Fe-2S)-binding protein [Pyrococcus]AAL81921.1 d-nopaline dehydrogenase [Pyrococcus furiosus DSM 3638]AFN04844.1 d-nopaline dehydrogenase [Pyrococcus furiosus COM1]MDK2870120.1 hypothetical protein [Pyrococcus sp.]QEK79399.1 (2Fe-2S)-binding protein [Pyrococcus furiosus DSM 3638]
MKIICRCNDVTLEEIERLIDEGVTELEELRRLLRLGMGPCQGRTCIPLVISILARKTGKKIEEIPLPNARFPVRPVKIEAFVEGEK